MIITYARISGLLLSLLLVSLTAAQDVVTTAPEPSQPDASTEASATANGIGVTSAGLTADGTSNDDTVEGQTSPGVATSKTGTTLPGGDGDRTEAGETSAGDDVTTAATTREETGADTSVTKVTEPAAQGETTNGPVDDEATTAADTSATAAETLPTETAEVVTGSDVTTIRVPDQELPANDSTVVTGANETVPVTDAASEPEVNVTTLRTITTTTRDVTNATEEEEVLPEQEVTTISLPVYTWPEGHQCNNLTTLADDWRHFTAAADPGNEHSDTTLAGWYSFTYQGAPAVITTTCIKEQYCGTFMPYHLDLEGSLPEVNTSVTADVCGPGTLAGQVGCCLQRRPVTIFNCGDKYIYLLESLPLSKSAICVQLPDEVIPLKYLALPPEDATEEPTTTEPKHVLPSVDYTELTAAQLEGVVTIEYNYSKDTENFASYMVDTFDLKFRKMIIDKLNNMSSEVPEEEETTVTTTSRPTTTTEQKIEEVTEKIIFKEGDSVPPGVKAPSPGPVVPNVDADADAKGPADTRRRRDNNGQQQYVTDDATYVGPTPQFGDGSMQAAVFVKDPESGAVPGDKMMAALEQLDESGQLSKEVGLPVVTFYRGLPPNLRPAPVKEDSGVWERHRGLLIALIVIASICLLIIILGICCIKCRKNRGSWSRDDDKVRIEEGRSKKRPMVMESPISDEEITKDEAPMMEHENPAMTSNGGGGHLSRKDEDNGWVVPIDELSKADKDRPEVEDTKL